jgi:hypothetical protein
VKQDNIEKKSGSNKTDTSAIVKHDSSHHVHSGTGAKKLTCCIGPPSRIKIKADKK